ncbi:MAG: F0F1 ATP synthase subunit delta [Endozoicomonas sp. (ex Botrylloides leachii)]|nr:F0F1 ATP synthase subunit delta [Endozoicomonas sp. (ex Botrylloides leachii)]
MELTTCARPYARAAFEYAKQQGTLSQWSTMLSLCASIACHKKVISLLVNPALSGKQQLKTFLGLCEGYLTKEMNNYIAILADNKRINLLPVIYALFIQLKAEEERSQEVSVISALPLTQDQVDQLAIKVETRLGRRVKLNIKIDSSLIGGVIIKAGDLVIDGSLRARLAKLAEAMIS